MQTAHSIREITDGVLLTVQKQFANRITSDTYRFNNRSEAKAFAASSFA